MRHRDESFQAIDYNGTDNCKQGIKTLHISEMQKKTEKRVLANKTD